MPIRLCSKCTTKVPPELSSCACGGIAVEYLEPHEATFEEGGATSGLRARDVGAAVGSFVTQGSTLGVSVGYTVGKKLEEVMEGKAIVTFKPVEPESKPRDLAVEAASVLVAGGRRIRRKLADSGRGALRKFRRKFRKKERETP